MKQKKKDTIFYVFTVVSCLVAMIVVVIAALLVYDKIKDAAEQKAQKEAQEALAQSPPLIYTQDDVDFMMTKAVNDAREQAKLEGEGAILSTIQERLAQGSTVMETLRPLYPDKLIISSGGIYHFVPIQYDLKMHERKQENLSVLESGELQYKVDEKVVTQKGIDVSKYQGDIDWKKVAEDGVEYAFIRVGIRGYGEEGKIVLDDKFTKNVTGAKKAGIKVGVYFFGQAITEEEAREEAAFVLKQIAPYDIDYPVVYDLEKVSVENGRMNALTPTQRTDVTIAFLEAIKEAGYEPMLYANTEMLGVLVEMERLEDYEKWFAYYGTEMYFPYDYVIWQYTDKGTVNGIKGDVDLNISFKEW